MEKSAHPSITKAPSFWSSDHLFPRCPNLSFIDPPRFLLTITPACSTRILLFRFCFLLPFLYIALSFDLRWLERRIDRTDAGLVFTFVSWGCSKFFLTPSSWFLIFCAACIIVSSHDVDAPIKSSLVKKWILCWNKKSAGLETIRAYESETELVR